MAALVGRVMFLLLRHLMHSCVLQLGGHRPEILVYFQLSRAAPRTVELI